MYVQFAQRFLCVVLALPLCLLSAATWSQEAGRGLTADLEVGYLQFIIDHHFAALRLTELAAGTEEIRQSEITDEEGVSPTPETDALEGRAEREELRSLARKVNNRDREEILTAQRYLEEWYGIQHHPRLTEGDEVLIRELDQAQGGSDFDGLFLEVLSVHHYRATVATLNCIVGRDIAHDQLYRFCKSILEQALLEIDDMRELLLSEFGIEDFQPFAVPEIDDFAHRNNLPIFPSTHRAHRARIPVARGVIGTRSLGEQAFLRGLLLEWVPPALAQAPAAPPE